MLLNVLHNAEHGLLAMHDEGWTGPSSVTWLLTVTTGGGSQVEWREWPRLWHGG